MYQTIALPSVAIFTSAKSFGGSFGASQRLALESWKRLRPLPRIVFLGDKTDQALLNVRRLEINGMSWILCP